MTKKKKQTACRLKQGPAPGGRPGNAMHMKTMHGPMTYPLLAALMRRAQQPNRRELTKHNA